jgi:hypothetical protein
MAGTRCSSLDRSCRSRMSSSLRLPVPVALGNQFAAAAPIAGPRVRPPRPPPVTRKTPRPLTPKRCTETSAHDPALSRRCHRTPGSRRAPVEVGRIAAGSGPVRGQQHDPDRRYHGGLGHSTTAPPLAAPSVDQCNDLPTSAALTVEPGPTARWRPRRGAY